MNRYVLGFKKFGPPELNKDGDWVKFDDHYFALNEKDSIIDEKEMIINKCALECVQLTEQRDKKSFQFNVIATLFGASIIANAILAYLVSL